MDREALRALGEDGLLDLVEELHARVAALEAEGRATAQAEGARYFVGPARAGLHGEPRRAASEEARAEAGPPGSEPSVRPADVVVRCRPTACRGCGEPLAVAGQRRVRRSEVVALPELRPVVVEAWGYAARCAACGERTVADLPIELGPSRTFGSRLEALLGYLHHGHHLSHERLVAVCGSVFGLRISEGAIAAALARLATRARPAAEAIRERIRASPTINSDETGVRVDGRNW